MEMEIENIIVSDKKWYKQIPEKKLRIKNEHSLPFIKHNL